MGQVPKGFLHPAVAPILTMKVYPVGAKPQKGFYILLLLFDSPWRCTGSGAKAGIAPSGYAGCRARECGAWPSCRRRPPGFWETSLPSPDDSSDETGRRTTERTRKQVRHAKTKPNHKTTKTKSKLQIHRKKKTSHFIHNSWHFLITPSTRKQNKPNATKTYQTSKTKQNKKKKKNKPTPNRNKPN